ncbi:MAG TPA: FecR domain-containing protein, partial [Candidatus Omnitrophota bacterium]|nr:FecR domain-containing protein [Candidatus Omnitrophota bacterium]
DWTFWELYFGDGTTEGATQKNGTNKITALTELKIQLKHTLKAGSSNWDLSWGGGYLTDVIQIAAGGSHTLALLANGTVMSWGLSGFGHSIWEVTTDVVTPVLVSGLSNVTAIAVGDFHFLALLSDGTVKSWGSNVYGQLGNGTTIDSSTPVTVSGLSGVSAISAGYNHSLALIGSGTDSGKVWAWGYNASGQLGDGTTTTRLAPVAVSGLSAVTAIAAGYQHSLALLSDKTVKSWGGNGYGQLGDGTTTTRLTPVTVSGLSGVTSINSGAAHSLALLSGGTVKSWGWNAFGQLGDGTTTDRWTPVTVSGLADVSTLATNGNHSLALLADGTVKSWGTNGVGSLGDGTTTDRWTPVPVLGLEGVTAIATGGGHSIALSVTGTVYGWGQNQCGQLGNNSTSFAVVAPVHVLTAIESLTSLTNISKIVSGGFHSLALKSDGSCVYAWGENDSGQLGDTTNSAARTPVRVWNEEGTDYLSGVLDIQAGSEYSLALLSDGTVKSWGANRYGQLGNGTLTSSPIPTTVSGLSDVRAIVAGEYHALALLSGGTVKSWGWNSAGQLGDGTTTDRLVPVTVCGLSEVTAIAASYDHSLALLSDHTVKSWGDNTQGELGDGTTTMRLTPVAVSGLTGVTAIDAGERFSLALLSNGTVKSWGWNTYKQLGDGTATNRSTPVTVSGLSGVTAISAGIFHSLALMSDGTVKSWGSNGYGELGNGSVISSAIPVTVSGLADVSVISAGYDFSTALFLDEAANVIQGKSWGKNSSGQLGNNSVANATVPVDVSAVLRAPLLDSEIDNIKYGVLEAQDSTFLFTGEYGFGPVTFTQIPDTQFNNLVLRGALDSYVSRALDKVGPITLQELQGRVRGKLEFSNEQERKLEIDVKKAKSNFEEAQKGLQKYLDGLGGRTLNHRFGDFFDPANVLRFKVSTGVFVKEGVVFVVDGANELSFLEEGNGLRVNFKRPVPNPAEDMGRAGEFVKKNTELMVATPVFQHRREGAPGINPTSRPGQFGSSGVNPELLQVHRAELKDPGRDVFVRSPGGQWRPATTGTVLVPGDELRTITGSSVKMLLDGGAVGQVEVSERSFLRIGKAETNTVTGDKTTLLELAVGKVLVHAEKLKGDSKFEVRTPTALTGVRGTTFTVEVKERE